MSIISSVGKVFEHITRPAGVAIDDVRKALTSALERNSYVLISAPPPSLMA